MNCVQQNFRNHHHRTELANIISQLNLSPNEVAVYFILKKIAGDNGSCYMSCQKIADMCNVSLKVFYRTKERLCQNYKIINCPLIICTNRKTEQGDKDTNLITIVDIWDENYLFYIGNGSAKNDSTGSAKNDSTVVPKTPYKEEPFQEEPFKEDKGLANSALAGSEIPLKNKETKNAEAPEAEASNEPEGEKIFYMARSGSLMSITKSEVFSSLAKSGFDAQVISAAIKKFILRKGKIGDPIKLIALMCEDIKKSNKGQVPPKESVYKEIKNPTKLKLR